MTLADYDPLRNTVSDFSTKLQMAKVIAYDYQVDQQGSFILDKRGNRIPTGLLTVQFLDRDGGRPKVPFQMLMGNTMAMGGLPEIGMYCIVGFRQQNVPVIVGFLPPGVANVAHGRQTVPNMIAGEVIMQSSISDSDVDGNDQFFKGATVFLDRYGRYTIDCEGYSLIVGYLLSDEYTADVSWVNDPITGSPIYLREKMPAGTERRVDDQGNAVWTVGRNKYERVGGDVDIQVAGALIQLAKTGQKFTDDKGNYIQLSENGTLKLVSTTGDVYQFANGKWDVEVVGGAHHKVMLSFSMTVGENHSTIVGGDLTVGISGAEKKTVTKGDSEEKILTGSKKITATVNIELTATGQIKLAATGQVNINGAVVNLNGSAYSAPQWELWLVAFKAFLTTLKTVVSPATASAVGTAATALDAALTAGLDFKSTLVKHG
jgi:hypothetical protein